MLDLPELRLDVRLQEMLAIMLVDAAFRLNKQIIVATQSPHILAGIVKLLEGKVKLDVELPEDVQDVAVYHVYRDGTGYTKTQRLEIEQVRNIISMYLHVEGNFRENVKTTVESDVQYIVKVV